MDRSVLNESMPERARSGIVSFIYPSQIPWHVIAITGLDNPATLITFQWTHLADDEMKTWLWFNIREIVTGTDQ